MGHRWPFYYNVWEFEGFGGSHGAKLHAMPICFLLYIRGHTCRLRAPRVACSRPGASHTYSTLLLYANSLRSPSLRCEWKKPPSLTPSPYTVPFSKTRYYRIFFFVLSRSSACFFEGFFLSFFESGYNWLSRVIMVNFLVAISDDSFPIHSSFNK